MKAVAAVCTSCLLLCGCLAVGVPATDDPWKKYLYGCALYESGRIFPAYRLLGESLDYYEHAGDPQRLGMVQLAYADVLRSHTVATHALFEKRRQALGGAEALPVRSRELVAKARDNFEVASASPAAQASPAERTQDLILLLDAQKRLGDGAAACATLQRAEASFGQAAGLQYRYATYRFKTVPELLAFRRNELGCASR